MKTSKITIIFFCVLLSLFFCASLFAEDASRPPSVNNEILFVPESNKQAPPPKIIVEGRLEKVSVPFDSEVVFHVTVSWLGQGGRYSLDFPSRPRLQNLEMLASSMENLSESSDVGTTFIKRFTYRFRARHQEPAEIGTVSVKYEDTLTHIKSTVSTQAVSLTILPPNKESFRKTFYISSIIAVLIILAVFVYLVVLKRGRLSKNKEFESLPEFTIEEKVERELDKLEILHNSGDIKEFYSGVSRLLKTYLFDKYNIESLKGTTAKIDNLLKDAGFPEEFQVTVDRVLSVCDNVKFAQYNPEPNEFERVKNKFLTLLSSTVKLEKKVQEEKKRENPSLYRN